MPRTSDRPSWEQDGNAAPVPHRLLPSHNPQRSKAKPAGCWTMPLVLLVLLSCSIAEGVRKFAEPIDRGGCRVDCRLAGEDFIMYSYETDSCWCQTADGSLVER